MFLSISYLEGEEEETQSTINQCYKERFPSAMYHQMHQARKNSNKCIGNAYHSHLLVGEGLPEKISEITSNLCKNNN